MKHPPHVEIVIKDACNKRIAIREWYNKYHKDNRLQ